MRHGKIHDLLPEICWYLCETWQFVQIVACDRLVSVLAMVRNTILLPMTWYLSEACQDVRLVACDLLVSV